MRVVINLNYFKIGNPSPDRNALVDITVKATGASATSVKRIVSEKDGAKLPGKSRPKRKKIKFVNKLFIELINFVRISI